MFRNLFTSSEGFAELKISQCLLRSVLLASFQPGLESTSRHWLRNSPLRWERLREMRGWVPFGIACDLWREVAANCRVRRGSSGYMVSAHSHMNNKHNDLILTPP